MIEIKEAKHGYLCQVCFSPEETKEINFKAEQTGVIVRLCEKCRKELFGHLLAEFQRSQDEKWHKTSKELPKLTGDHDVITVQAFDSPESWMIEKGFEPKVYIVHYCRRKIRGIIVDRFESKQYTLLGSDPEYWKYLSEPPMVKKEGEKNE